MVFSTDRRIGIINAIAESKQQDRNSIMNQLMLEWILNNLDDPDYIEPIKYIFNNTPPKQ